MSNRDLPESDWRRTVYGRSTISGISVRRAPRVAERAHILETQGNRCLYCELPIGTTIWRKAQTVTLRTNWDHFVPYAYLARNPHTNWVLACHVCNGIKSCRMFDSVQAARAVILPTREAKGYEDPKTVLLRLGLTPEEDPWPEKFRPKGSAYYHAARLITPGLYLTACSLELDAATGREIQSHQIQCSKCTVRRDVPVVPPSIIPAPRESHGDFEQDTP